MPSNTLCKASNCVFLHMTNYCLVSEEDHNGKEYRANDNPEYNLTKKPPYSLENQEYQRNNSGNRHTPFIYQIPGRALKIIRTDIHSELLPKAHAAAKCIQKAGKKIIELINVRQEYHLQQTKEEQSAEDSSPLDRRKIQSHNKNGSTCQKSAKQQEFFHKSLIICEYVSNINFNSIAIKFILVHI